MINSKQLVEITGISRATLNNYVGLGILPNPVVRTPAGDEARATRLGYFDDEAVDIIQKVQALKKEGLSMAQIAKELGKQNNDDKVSSAGEQGSLTNFSDQNITWDESIDNLPAPAYMVNNNFELIWWNDKAAQQVFHYSDDLPGNLEARNLIKLLLSEKSAENSDKLRELLLPHLTAGKKRLTQQTLIKIYSSLSSEQLGFLKDIYNQAEPLGKEPMTHFPIMLDDAEGNPQPADLYVCFYREGIFFTYSPVNLESDYLLNFLSKRNFVINELMKKRKPHLTDVAVMVADLQNSTRICSELPAEEYFELINNIWQESESVFRKYYGTYGKHVGDGMVYYFFPQPDCDYRLNAIACSLELKQMMRKITQRWQARKGWFSDLFLNIGLNVGQEWFGSYHAAGHVEFTVLGETINHASRLSDFARGGSIWATKSMLNQIPGKNRNDIGFGITRLANNGESVFVTDTYASLGSMMPDGVIAEKYEQVQMMPITEIRSMSGNEALDRED